MKRLVSIMLLTLVFGLIYAFSPRFSTPPTTNAAGSAPVTVVNTPLPANIVSGNVNAVVTNPTNGTTGNPVPLVVKNSDNAARNFFTSSPTLPCTSNGFGCTATLSVPAGNIAVVQYVSAFCGSGPAPLAEATISGSVGSTTSFTSYLQMGPTSTSSGNPGIFFQTLAQQVTAYLDGGSAGGSIQLVLAAIDQNETTVDCNVNVNGYLVAK